MGESVPDLSALGATGVLRPRLLAAVKRIEEALPLAGAPEAKMEQRRSLEALRLELPDGHSVGCSYWQCVDVPAVSVVYVLGVHLMSVTYVEHRGYGQWTCAGCYVSQRLDCAPRRVPPWLCPGCGSYAFRLPSACAYDAACCSTRCSRRSGSR